MVILFTILVALSIYFLKTSISKAHCDTMMVRSTSSSKSFGNEKHQSNFNMDST